VLLHGLSSNSRIWDLTAPYLLERFRVIAIDQRGHGLSDKPDEGYGFKNVTADVAELLELLVVKRPVVVGHSWGGAVAVQFAASYPDAPVAIVLVDGGFTELSQRVTWEAAQEQMRPPEIDGVPVERFVGFMKKWPQLQDIWSDDIKEMVLSNFEVREDGTIARHLSVPKHMMIARELYEQKTSDLYPRVRCPALLIPCERDPTNDMERRWHEWRGEGIALAQQRLPNCTVLPFQDTIHDVPIQRPAELAGAIIQFAAGNG